MTDELMILSGLDQSLDVSEDWILQEVDKIINKSVEEHDAFIALNACKQLVQVSKLSGLGLAKALYLIKKNWYLYKMEEEFEDVAYAHIGLHKHTVDRYAITWEMYDNKSVPEQYQEQIKQRNIRDQIPIARALEQGYQLEEQDWKELANAPDFSTVSKIIRDVKGQPPRSNALQIYIDNIGTLWAYQDTEKYFVGSLEVQNEDTTVQKAISRIINHSGIMER